MDALKAGSPFFENQISDRKGDALVKNKIFSKD
jgi:hypothetical protein